MEITRIEVERLSVPLRRPIRTAVHNFTHAHTVLVQMHTSSGETGTGWCFAFEAGKAAALAALAEDMTRLYVGRDARAVRARFDDVWKDLNFLGHAGAALIAASALDTACWDLAARAADLPLFRYLGGERTRVETYASSGLWLDRGLDELISEARGFVADGHRAMKMRVGHADFTADVERVREVRTALGPDIALLVDANQGWSESVAIRAGRAFEELGVYWLEEPLFYDDLEGCARVAAALDMRVATGETSYGSAAMKRHLDLRVADVLMPDLQRMGGITEYLKTCALCAAYHQPVSSHLFTEASVHVLAAQANALMLEHMEWWEELFEDPLTLEDGAVTLPEGPGLGLRLSGRALEKFRA